MRRKGFTLIELSIVLLLVALMAGAVALRIEGPLRRNTLEDLCDKIADLDRTTRQMARLQDRPLWLVFDGGAGQIRRIDECGEMVGTAFEIPDGFTVAQLQLRGQRLAATACIPFAAAGASPTYAVCLQDRNHAPRWLAVAGMTGEVTEFADESQVQNLWAQMR